MLTRTYAFGLLVAFYGAWLLGCGRAASGPEPSGATASLRFIEEAPHELLEVDDFSRLVPVFEDSFAGAGTLGEWRLTATDVEHRVDQEGLHLRSSVPVELVRSVAFDAGTVEIVEIVVARRSNVPYRLYWSGASETLGEERSLELEDSAVGARSTTTLRFEVARHPLWRGRIARLGLEIGTRAEKSVLLREVRGGSREVVPERLTAARERPWLVDLDHDVRSALIQLPGAPLERRFEVPPRSALRFAYGLPEAARHPVSFRVSISARGAEPEVLFERTIGEAADRSGRWWDHSIDLSSFAGEDVLLRLETESPEALDLAFWAHPEVATPLEAPPPSVILISIDTLRADHLSLYGYHRPTSPCLDRWARGSAVVFEKVVAPSPWTLPSHVSMLTGLDAHRHGVNHFLAAPPSLRTLAEVLREAGYLTAAVTGGSFIHPKFGLAQGFDVFRYWQETDRSQELEQAIEETARLLESYRTQPFFLFLHTYEVHEPYRARQPYFDAWSELPSDRLVRIRQKPGLDEERHLHRNYFVSFPEGEPDASGEPLPPELGRLAVDLYDSGIAYTDAQLCRLFEHLDGLGLTSRALIVLTSDHGEMLGEHGLAGHAFLYDPNLLVPLVVDPPGDLGGGRRVAEQVRTIDVVPTILDTLGIPLPAGLDGISLRPWIEGGGVSGAPGPAWSYAASSGHGLSLRVDDRLKYIFRNGAWPPHRGLQELYDLQVDPAETSNLAPGRPRVEELRARARQVLDRWLPGVRLRLENRGNLTHRGRLEAGGLSLGLKSTDLACPCLRAVNEAAVSFTLPPETAFTLVLENVQDHVLQVSAVAEEQGPDRGFFATVDLSELSDEPRAWTFDGSSWKEADAEPATHGASIEIWRQGEAPPGESAAVRDTELERQLRALGYLG